MTDKETVMAACITAAIFFFVGLYNGSHVIKDRVVEDCTRMSMTRMNDTVIKCEVVK